MAEMEDRRETTLLNLIAELQAQGVKTEHELVRLITYLVSSGRIRLTGTFATAETHFSH